MTHSSQTGTAGPLRTTTWNALLQRDVFHCILDCLAAPEASLKQFRESRPVLVSLAQTCRAFSEPSLDHLWSRLDSLEPLIRCFATVLNEERAKTPPSSAEWIIIHRYSHRIRELSIGPLDRFSLLFLRSTSSHPQPLLVPNLRVLKWRSQTRPFLSIKFIQRFLSPSLITLNITLRDAGDARLQSFLASYPSLCPDLRSIVINIAGRRQVSSTTIGTLSEAIPHHVHLESLDVSVPINDVALTHIAISPTFKRLTLVLHPGMSDLHKVSASDITPFRNVEELSLEVCDLNFVTTLLRTQDQMFRSFVLRYCFPPTTDAAFTLFSALASRQRTRSLRSISLMPTISDRIDVKGFHSAPGEFDESAMHCHLTYDALRPLTSLSHLRELVIDLGHWFSIDDDDLVSLTRNWPLLQVLHLNRRQHVQGRPWRLVKYVTFKGLSSLLECCPDLHNFCLPLDAREVLANTGKIIGNTAVTYIHSPNTPTVILVCWKKS